MRTRFLYLHLIIAAMMLLLTGCRGPNPEEIASMIEISYPVSQEMRAGTGYGIGITLINNSTYCIVFLESTGMTIYTMEDGIRLEVQNMIAVINEEGFVLEPGGREFSRGLLSIAPDISQITVAEPKQFFVDLTGYLCDDKTIKIKKIIPFTVIP